MLTLQQAGDEIAQLFGSESLEEESDFFKTAVLRVIHAALQEFYALSPAWVSHQTLTVATTVAQSYVTLPSQFVSLVGPVWRDTTPGTLDWKLSPINSHEQWLHLLNGNIHLAETLYYFLETSQVTSAANSVRSRLLLYPTPTTVWDVHLDAKVGPQTFALADLTNGTAVTLAIPHSYHESVFLPIAKNRAKSSPLFEGGAAIVAAISEEYRTAKLILDDAKPNSVGRNRVGTPENW